MRLQTFPIGGKVLFLASLALQAIHFVDLFLAAKQDYDPVISFLLVQDIQLVVPPTFEFSVWKLWCSQLSRGTISANYKHHC